jgi:protein-S-isoprenylcysteine O-methyltransferase Ste14
MRPVPLPSRAVLFVAWTGAAAFVAALLVFLHAYLVRFGDAAREGPIVPPIVLNVLLFSAFALHHSLLARPWAKATVHELVPPPLERAIYTWAASLLFVAVCWFWQPVPGELYRLGGIAAVAGYTVQALGIALTLRSAARLDVLDLAGVRPALDTGRGQDRPPRLVTGGVYGLVRHPVYLGWVLLVFGTPAMTATRLVFAAVSTAYLVAAVPFEERGLVHAFGAEYRRYQARVRWRIVPGIY